MDATLRTAHLCPPGAWRFAGLRAVEPLGRRNALCPPACADGSTGLADRGSTGLTEDRSAEFAAGSQRRIGEISALGNGIG